MVHLILEPSAEIAKIAYALLFRTAWKRTEYLVVEAAVDTSSEGVKFELPAELIHLLQDAQYLNPGEDMVLFFSRFFFGILTGVSRKHLRGCWDGC